MASSTPPSLCRLCRTINPKPDTFVEQGWRYPTSLEYESIDDIFDRNSPDTDRHYVPGERLDDAKHYTDDELGQKIKTLPIEHEFDGEGILVSTRPVKKKVLGTLREITERAEQCALCSVVVAASKLPRLSEHPGNELLASDTCTIRFDYIGQGKGGLVPSLYEKDESLRYERYDCTLRIGEFEANLYPICDEPQMAWFGGRTYDVQVDFSLLKNWLRVCEQSHERCGLQDWQKESKSPPRLRLIDVHDMCLVDATEDDRYVALSYVWGSVRTFQTKKALVPALYGRGGLQSVLEDISRTVQDAVLVVRGLGERFLWTDAICIVQDDPVDKAELIKEMDTVYARATLTIVAAEGEHANSGLPGIHPYSRSAPETYNVGAGLSLLLAHAPIGRTLLDCPWSKRAWTFQECVLSARQLVFTHSTVHFVCCSTTWSEDVKCISEDFAPPWKWAAGTMFDFRPSLSEVNGQLTSLAVTPEIEDDDDDDEECDPLSDLWIEVVGNLSMRKLSFEADILFAAAGMISVLERIFRVRSVFGMQERRLEQFLFWSPMEPGCLRRRRDVHGRALYPSWSWAGWVGEVSWPEHTARPYGSPMKGIEWMGLPKHGTQPVTLQSGGRGTVRDDALAATSTYDSQVHDVQLDLPNLQFATRTARLNISTTAPPPEWISELQTLAWTTVRPDSSAQRHGVYCITSLDDEDDVIGSVVLDSLDVIHGLDSLVTKFAIASSVPYQEPQYEGSFALVFHRVLALREGGEGKVLERIGHGAVVVRENDSVGWVDETVVLG